MKQYRITSANIPINDANDCYLAPDDPIHELIITHSLGGLNSHNRLQEYRAKNTPTVEFIDKGKIQREKNIKPGTDEWFQLWGRKL